jgi:hypothetical protein
MAKLATLTDSFNFQDDSKWTDPNGLGWRDATRVANGRLEIDCLEDQWGQLVSATNYDITDSYARIELVSVPVQTGSEPVAVYFSVEWGAPTDTVEFAVQDGLLNWKVFSYSTVQFAAGSIPYSPVSMRWLQIRYLQGSAILETSPDGWSWKKRGSGSVGWDPTDVRVRLRAGGSTGTPGAPDKAIFDNFNASPALAVDGGTTGGVRKAAAFTWDMTNWEGHRWTMFEPEKHAVVNGQFVVTPTANANNYSRIQTADLFDLTNSEVAVEVVQTLNNVSGCETQLVVAKDAANQLVFFRGANTMVMRARVSGTNTGPFVTYSAVNHRWWRLREALGVTYWEASPDGRVWTELRSMATPFDMSLVSIQLNVGTWQGVATPGVAIFDNLNLPNRRSFFFGG